MPSLVRVLAGGHQGRSGGLHLVAEQAAIFCRVPFREGDGVLVVALLAEFFGGFFAIVLDDIIELTVIVVVRHTAGRLGRCLPEECQDHDGDPHQQEVAFFERKSHEDLYVRSDWLVQVAVVGQEPEPEQHGKHSITCRTLQPAVVLTPVTQKLPVVTGFSFIDYKDWSRCELSRCG